MKSFRLSENVELGLELRLGLWFAEIRFRASIVDHKQWNAILLIYQQTEKLKLKVFQLLIILSNL